MVFSGFKVGDAVEHGGILTECQPESNPCRRAYVDYLGPNVAWQSWDPVTLLYAIRDAAAAGCHEEGQGGTNSIEFDGNNKWIPGSSSNQTYLILDNAELPGDAIDELLCAEPGNSRK